MPDEKVQDKKMVSEETRRKMSEAQKKRRGTDPDGRRILSEEQWREITSEETRRKMSEAQRKRRGTDPETPMARENACEILKKHHETLKEDPEHLSTEFMQKLI